MVGASGIGGGAASTIAHEATMPASARSDATRGTRRACPTSRISRYGCARIAIAPTSFSQTLWTVETLLNHWRTMTVASAPNMSAASRLRAERACAHSAAVRTATSTKTTWGRSCATWSSTVGALPLLRVEYWSPPVGASPIGTSGSRRSASKGATNGWRRGWGISGRTSERLPGGRRTQPTDQRGGLRAPGQAQLAQDVADVRLDGVLAQVQLGRDLAVRLAGRDHRDDPPVVLGERGQRVGVARRAAPQPL